MMRLFGFDSSRAAAVAEQQPEQQVALTPDQRYLVAEQRIQNLERQLAAALVAGHQRLSNLEKWRVEDLGRLSTMQTQVLDARAEAASLKEEQGRMAERLEELEAEIRSLQAAIKQERHGLLEAELAQKEWRLKKVQEEIQSVRNGAIFSLIPAAGVGAGVGAFGGPLGVLIGGLAGLLGAPFIYIPVKKGDLLKLSAEENSLKGRIALLKNLLHPPAV